MRSGPSSGPSTTWPPPPHHLTHCALVQHVQFKLADMATNLHVARMAVRDAARQLDARSPNARVAAAMAKRVATDLGFQVRSAAPWPAVPHRRPDHRLRRRSAMTPCSCTAATAT